MTTLIHIADRVINRPLMILPEKLALISSVLEGRLGVDTKDVAGGDQSLLALLGNVDASRFSGQSRSAAGAEKPYRLTADGVANIAVLGSLVNRGAWIGARSGLTSYEGLKMQIAAAAADGDVRAIVLDIDSPGGEAVGAFEVADVVRAANAQKPVVAVVNGMAASAAYAIASGAGKIVTTSSGVVGSIGVVMLHADYSHALHERGVKPTLIHAGARKVDGNPYHPLTEDVKAELKAEIDSFYSLFVSSVATGRKGLSEDAIRKTEARTFIGKNAVDLKLADEVGSFETVLSELSRGASRYPANRSRQSMSETTKEPSAEAADKKFTQADLDRARAEGEATGKKAGATAERERVKGICGSEEAKGREASAQHIAFSTDMSVEDAKGVLAGVAVTKTEDKKPDPAVNRGPNGISTLEVTGAEKRAAKNAIDLSAIYGDRRKAVGQ